MCSTFSKTELGFRHEGMFKISWSFHIFKSSDRWQKKNSWDSKYEIIFQNRKSENISQNLKSENILSRQILFCFLLNQPFFCHRSENLEIWKLQGKNMLSIISCRKPNFVLWAGAAHLFKHIRVLLLVDYRCCITPKQTHRGVDFQ